MRQISILIVGIGLFLFSCSDIDTSQPAFDYNYSYFPVDSGIWHEYSVLQITIDEETDVYDTLNYYLLEKFEDSYIDGENDTLRQLNRYYRDSIHKSWQLLSIWLVGLKQNEAIEVEENIKYVKIKFPAQLDLSWNGNAYNRTDTLSLFDYTISQIDYPLSENGLVFDSVLTVSQREFLSNVEKYSYIEKYANTVGLVYKEAISIYSETVDLNIPIEERVTSGTMYYQEMIDYGKEY